MREEFHIGIGGPLNRVEHAARLDSPQRRALAVVLVAWVPLVVLWIVERLIGGRNEPLMRDLSIHARLLVAAPIFVAAEPLLDAMCARTTKRLFDEGYVSGEDARSLLRRTERWRDSLLPELLFLVVAVGTGLASLLGVLAPAGVVHGVAEAQPGPARTWYELVSLPLFQFLLARSLFRWGLWGRLLGGFSRLPLRLLPMHADRRGGIGFLKRPSLLYGAVLALATGSVLSGAWGTRIYLEGARLAEFKAYFAGFVVVVVAIALAPLFAFATPLFRSRQRALVEYGALVGDYARRFDERWLGPHPDPLGSSDFQSLADLGNSYRENIEKMQFLLVTPRDLIVLLAVAIIPALPVVLSQVPAKEVLERVLKLVSGAG